MSAYWWLSFRDSGTCIVPIDTDDVNAAVQRATELGCDPGSAEIRGSPLEAAEVRRIDPSYLGRLLSPAESKIASLMCGGLLPRSSEAWRPARWTYHVETQDPHWNGTALTVELGSDMKVWLGIGADGIARVMLYSGSEIASAGEMNAARFEEWLLDAVGDGADT